MSTVGSFRAVTSLLVAVTVGAFITAPACSESTCSDSGGDDSCANEGGAGNEGGAANTGGSGTTGGAVGSGGTGTEGGAGGGTATGGSSSEGGAGGGAGEGTSGGTDAGGAAGAGGAGGASGKTCTSPPAGQTGAKGKSCADYCDEFFANCAAYNADNSTWANKGECLSTCELFDDTQLCCRISHATSASTTVADCAEAAGDGTICN